MTAALRRLVDGEDVVLPNGMVFTPDGPAEDCKACGGTGKHGGDLDRVERGVFCDIIRSPPDYGADGCDECRGIGKTRRWKVRE
jgi:hypothetical protein